MRVHKELYDALVQSRVECILKGELENNHFFYRIRRNQTAYLFAMLHIARKIVMFFIFIQIEKLHRIWHSSLFRLYVYKSYFTSQKFANSLYGNESNMDNELRTRLINIRKYPSSPLLDAVLIHLPKITQRQPCENFST